MTDFKAGDYVFTQSKICAFLVNAVNKDTLDICHHTGIMSVDIQDCEKVYISDTPPPQITQTKVEIQSGHMAGYGEEKPKVVHWDNATDDLGDIVIYNNGMVFERNVIKWERLNNLPHEQEDLKHLF